MECRTEWVGTATELLTEMREQEVTPNMVTKYLGQFAYEVLEPLGIEYRTKRTGKSRLIKFLRRDGDDANDARIAIYRNPRHNRHCRHKPKKGGEQMRSKNYGINVRVTEQEKQKLLENARFCSLSLSEYLRRLGLGKDVKAAITELDYRLFRMLNGLKAELPQLQQEEILSRLEAILNELK